jgi:hypothetical protein
MKRYLRIVVLSIALSASLLTILLSSTVMSKPGTKLRIATFNVSMEALNYQHNNASGKASIKGDELAKSLAANHQQIRNIAEIIQRIDPDIILLNEFDRQDDSHQALNLFLQQYLAQPQQEQKGIQYPYFYQGPVNTGVKLDAAMKNDGHPAQLPADAFGFGYFPGHFAMALLSKYPITTDKIRTFQLFKWRDMPAALQPFDPVTKKPWYNNARWQSMRLSSKSHWDIPVIVNDQSIHLLASHPTPPVFDGLEDRNGKRNHDEIRFWHDYISPDKGDYIYDDKMKYGGLSQDHAFVILGDLNASDLDGDALSAGISSLLGHANIQDPKPQSIGALQHHKDNANSKYHTAAWGMRADYVLPSRLGWRIEDSGVFWPKKQDDAFRLIKDRQASSDHRLVWVDLDLQPITD